MIETWMKDDLDSDNECHIVNLQHSTFFTRNDKQCWVKECWLHYMSGFHLVSSNTNRIGDSKCNIQCTQQGQGSLCFQVDIATSSVKQANGKCCDYCPLIPWPTELHIPTDYIMASELITVFVNLGFFRHFETVTNIRTWIKSHKHWRML